VCRRPGVSALINSRPDQDRELGGPRFYVRRPACFPARPALNQMRFSSDTCVLDNLTENRKRQRNPNYRLSPAPSPPNRLA
jgi:hypothetical protein